MSTELVTLPIPTANGEFLAHYSAQGLAELDFPHTAVKRAKAPETIPTAIRAWHRITESALKCILAGKKPAKLPPLAAHGTDFQKSVWTAMQAIPLGNTRSYGEIARSIGRPKAVRAVGGACGANPIPVLVPCHRILAANNKIGGFGGGLAWKRRLLTAEGVQVG
jgi:O-6-methylguanine DNA methyltransferase